uniref:Uncharacterized protein n=1 Tax=Arundo donax TaxID=35708 RepID=A0A0A9EIV3_ARUDO
MARAIYIYHRPAGQRLQSRSYLAVRVFSSCLRRLCFPLSPS